MKKHLSKKRVVLAAIVVVALAIASGVAYAYWTAGGSGTGTAAAAASTSNLTVNQSTVLAAMYPGDSAQTISGNFNNANSGPVFVSTVTASIASVVKAGGAPAGTCDSSDFTLANTVATVNAEIPVGNNQGAWTGPTIKFDNKASNQDACKGATVNLAYSIP
jgi:hypothetical protein